MNPDVAVLTEVDLMKFDAQAVFLPGYICHTCAPNPDDKIRLLVLTKKSVKVSSVHLAPGLPVVVLDLGRVSLVGLYRQFSSDGNKGLPLELTQLESLMSFIDQRCCDKAAIIAGDINLDMSKKNDPEYRRQPLLTAWLAAISRLGSQWIPTPHTWKSYGSHGTAGHHYSTLDHIYAPSGTGATATIKLDSTTDHYPVVAEIPIGRPPAAKKRLPRKRQRNFANTDYELLRAELSALADWPTPPPERPSELILQDIYGVIEPALDRHAPFKEFIVREDTPYLTLAPDTLALIARRDAARNSRKKGQYKALRNLVVSRIRRDKIKSSIDKISRAEDSSSASWQVAKSYLHGKDSLPSLADCQTDDESAAKANTFFMNKITDLRSGLCHSSPASTSNAAQTHPAPRTFSLHEVGYSTIRSAVASIGYSNALGLDGIPACFWKKAIAVLVRPLTFVINASIRHGQVPDIFKKSIVHPVYKGKGKDSKDPASYRPIAILPAVSKIL